jgi:hypothetical protein
MGEKRLYVRVRGKVLGPFDLRQLKLQRDRGQLGRFHEISEDRVSWQLASTIQELFAEEEQIAKGPPPGTKAPKSTPGPASDSSSGGPPPTSGSWHYQAADGAQSGPVSREQLLDLLDQGKIEPETLVWNSSLSGWVPFETVPSLGQRGKPSLKKRTGSLNILALSSALAALVWVGGLGSLAGIILGILALFDMRRKKAATGSWMAWTGIIGGAAGLVLTPIVGVGIYFAVHESQYTPEQISDRYKEKVYIIETATGSGSGILLANSSSRGLIATNLHVLNEGLVDKPEARRLMRENSIKKESTVEVKNPFQVTARKARVAAFHRDNDLALLILELDNARPGSVTIVRRHGLHDGEGAVALGYPLGLDYKVSPGAISGTSGEQGAVWTTCPINPGNSGGPLFVQRGGYLAGLNTFKKLQAVPVLDAKGNMVGVKGKDTQNLNGAEPAEEIVVPLQNGRTEKWIWSADLKDIVLDLAKLVSVKD